MTLPLINVNPQSLYFSNRPNRIVVHLNLNVYLDELTRRAGKDNLAIDPPNATLSAYEPGNSDNSKVVIENNNLVVDGSNLIYDNKVMFKNKC